MGRYGGYLEEKIVTWTCKLCSMRGFGMVFEVRDTEKKALVKLIAHLGKEHPKTYADMLWKIANEMEPIKVPQKEIPWRSPRGHY